jgi:uncharacterized repeat protein (TIGR01451 family)
MSRAVLQCRPFAIVFAVIILTASLLSALAWKVERAINPGLSALGAVRVEANPALLPRIAADYGKLPISFEVNQGQTDRSVKFLARGASYTLFLTPGEAVLSLHASRPTAAKAAHLAVQPPGRLPPSLERPASALRSSTVRLRLLGSNTKAEVAGVDPLPGKSNYFMGSDPAKWHTDVPTYARVRYYDIYPGIDLVYYGNQEGRLEHDFVLAPGADPNAIAIGLRDSDGVFPDQNGGLTLRTKAGELTLRSPVAYQTVGDQRKSIPATYLLANNQIRFQIGSYDRNLPLVIDPVLQYTAVFGGTGNDHAQAIAVDGAGNVYVTGDTVSVDFPMVHPFQGTTDGISFPTFISKINAAGTALLYSTYLGADSSWYVHGSGIAVDKIGRAYITGTTNGGLPTKNAFQPGYANANDGPEDWSDAFLTVLSPGGNSLVYSTYLGGTGEETGDQGTAIALDASANAYITGSTDSLDFPTLHSIQSQGTTFVAKFNSAGVLQYSSVFGPHPNPLGSVNSPPSPHAIAVDASGSAYITGLTSSTNVPITGNAFQKKCLGSCAFVTKFRPSGDSVAYSTYVGGYAVWGGSGIVVDGSGNAIIAGSTGPGFPAYKSGFQNTFGGGGSDCFVAKLNSSGSGLIWSTYLGGSGDDFITGLALDQFRQVYILGYTNSPNFPLKASLQVYKGGEMGFITTLSGSLGSIAYYSTYFGNRPYFVNAIAVDKTLNVYLAGSTEGGAIKPTSGALSTGTAVNPGGSEDIFVSKLVIMDDLTLGISASPSLSVKHGSNLTYTLSATSKGPDFGYNVRIDDPLPAGTTFVSSASNGGTCTTPAPGATGTLHCTLPRLDKGDTFTVALTVKVNAVAGSTLSNTATAASNMQDFIPSNNKATYTSKVN